MQRLIPLLFFLGVHAQTCVAPTDPLRSGDHTLTVVSGGRTRTFDLRIPSSYTGGATALILGFHGFNNNRACQCTNSGMYALAHTQGFFAVCASGVGNSWNGGECCGESALLNYDDVTFTRDMIRVLQTRICIDRNAIFSIGYSNGGYFSYRLACEASDLIRAIGNVAGLMSSAFQGRSCTQLRGSGRYVPVMHVHGSSDGTINYNTALTRYQTYRQGIECTGTAQRTFTNNTATCDTFQTCGQGARATFCTLQGMGHAWPRCYGTPGSGCGCSGASNDMDSTLRFWQFFRTVMDENTDVLPTSVVFNDTAATPVITVEAQQEVLELTDHVKETTD